MPGFLPRGICQDFCLCGIYQDVCPCMWYLCFVFSPQTCPHWFGGGRRSPADRDDPSGGLRGLRPLLPGGLREDEAAVSGSSGPTDGSEIVGPLCIHWTPLFIGIYRGIANPGFLGWWSSSIHSTVDGSEIVGPRNAKPWETRTLLLCPVAMENEKKGALNFLLVELKESEPFRTLVGIYRGIVILSFPRWCRSLCMHVLNTRGNAGSEGILCCLKLNQQRRVPVCSQKENPNHK